MKNFTLSILAVLFLSACGDSTTATTETEMPNAEKEAVIVDSLTSELETVEKEIDSNINALDDALKDL